MLKIFLLSLTSFFLSFSLNADSSLPKIVFMHGFKEGDFLGKKLIELVENYNKKPKAKGQVTLLAGGNYTESFKSLLSRKIHPHIAMVSEYNNLTMHNHPDMYVPLENVLDIKTISFLPVIRDFYSFDGKIVSYPFNCSAPVLYYNKDAFEKAGLPNKAPQTWEDIEAYSNKLVAAGYGGFTFAWPTAYALEHFAVVNNIPFSSHHNGFKNPQKARLLLNNSHFIQQLTFLQTQSNRGNFVYAGEKAEDAEQLFLDQKVSILMQGAHRSSLIQGKNPKLKIGVGPYPYKASLVKKPYAVNIGGTSLWVMNAYPEDRTAVADFLTYLSSAEVQAKWHQDTGYLPVTHEAFDLTKKSDFYKNHPVARVGVEQIIRFPQNLPAGIRLPAYEATRKKITDMLGRLFLENASIEKEISGLIQEQ